MADFGSAPKKEKQKTAADYADDARMFFEAGGVLLRGDWDVMPLAKKAAHVAARRLLDVRDAVRAGVATQGPKGVLQVAAHADGGQALEETLMMEAVRDA